MPSNELYTIEHEGESVLAWSCPCGEDKDEETVYLVEWREPENGVKYSMCHECCLRVEDEIND